jgi:hypothetical protein
MFTLSGSSRCYAPLPDAVGCDHWSVIVFFAQIIQIIHIGKLATPLAVVGTDARYDPITIKLAATRPVP